MTSALLVQCCAFLVSVMGKTASALTDSVLGFSLLFSYHWQYSFCITGSVLHFSLVSFFTSITGSGEFALTDSVLDFPLLSLPG